jgi:hypothetical protein
VTESGLLTITCEHTQAALGPGGAHTGEMKFRNDPFQLNNLEVRDQSLDERTVEAGGLLYEAHETVLQLPQLHGPLPAVLVLEVREVFAVLLDDSVVRIQPHLGLNHIVRLGKGEILEDNGFVGFLQPGDRVSSCF